MMESTNGQAMMRLVVLILCFTFSAGSSERTCRTAIDECSRKALTHGKCGNGLSRIQLDAMRTDINRDCLISSREYGRYAQLFLDMDGNGMVCKAEFIAAKKQYFGYSEGILNKMWDQKYGEEDCVDIEQMRNQEQPIRLNSYISKTVDQFARYCGQGPNLRDDVLSCSVIVDLCKGDFSENSACVEFISQENLPTEHRKTLYEKFKLHQIDLDKNNDGLVKIEEIGAFQNQQDFDGDGCATIEEAISYWIMQYNLTERNVRRGLNSGADVNNNGCFDLDDFAFIPEEGRSADLSPVDVASPLLGFCAADSTGNIFESDMDCGGAAFVCKHKFLGLDMCLPFEDCGLESYNRCVSKLKKTECSSWFDERYVDAEILSVRKLMEGCRVEPF